MGVRNLYGYTIDELATGIVRADSIEDAREKVKVVIKHIAIVMMNREITFLSGNWMKTHGLRIIQM